MYFPWASRLAASALLVMLIACVPQAATFTIAYDANGGAGTAPTDTNAYLAGATATIADPGGLSRIGSAFAGWNTEPNGMGTQHAPGATLTIGTSNLTLYATWRLQATIATGGGHTAALLSSGTLYTWGSNASGQLGDGTIANANAPTLVPNFPPTGSTITTTATGGNYTAALLGNGRLYTWGRNDNSQLGDGTTTSRNTPTLVPNFPPIGATITAIATGGAHTAALLSSGTLYTWGFNASSQLGDGNNFDLSTPTLVLNFPPAGATITAIAMGGAHTAALLSSGTLYTWGANSRGQLGDGTNIQRRTPTLVPNFPPAGTTITSIATGQNHTAALLSTGHLYTWGDNFGGQLGDGTRTHRNTPTLVPNFPPNGATITTIATSGGFHIAALLSDGRLYTWGYNVDGQLGDGTTTDRTTPTLVPNFPPTDATISTVATGGSHTAALLSDGRLYAWGWNDFGQLGDGTTTDRTTPTLVPDFPPLASP